MNCRYATGKHPIGADQIDYARERLANAAQDIKEKAEQLGNQAVAAQPGNKSTTTTTVQDST